MYVMDQRATCGSLFFFFHHVGSGESNLGPQACWHTPVLHESSHKPAHSTFEYILKAKSGSY